MFENKKLEFSAITLGISSLLSWIFLFIVDFTENIYSIAWKGLSVFFVFQKILIAVAIIVSIYGFFKIKKKAYILTLCISLIAALLLNSLIFRIIIFLCGLSFTIYWLIKKPHWKVTLIVLSSFIASTFILILVSIIVHRHFGLPSFHHISNGFEFIFYYLSQITVIFSKQLILVLVPFITAYITCLLFYLPPKKIKWIGIIPIIIAIYLLIGNYLVSCPDRFIPLRCEGPGGLPCLDRALVQKNGTVKFVLKNLLDDIKISNNVKSNKNCRNAELISINHNSTFPVEVKKDEKMLFEIQCESIQPTYQSMDTFLLELFDPCYPHYTRYGTDFEIQYEDESVHSDKIEITWDPSD